MIAVCVLPVLAIEAPELATVIAVELVRASAVAFLLIWGTWALFPDPHTPAAAADLRKALPMSSTSSPGVSVRNQPRIALINTLVVMPMVLVFLLFELSDAAVALITTLAIVRAQTQDVRLGIAGGLLKGNLVAGLAAVLGTTLIYAATSLLMVFAVVLLAALLLAGRMIAAPPARAPVWITALVSTVALLDGALAALSEGAGAVAWSRILNIGAAIIYTTAALRLTAGLRLLGSGPKMIDNQQQ
jgi:hypothetical protein